MDLSEVSKEQLSTLSKKQRLELIALLEEQENRRSRRKFFDIFPDEGPLRRELYHRHLEFIEAGVQYNERGMISANRIGKTQTAAFETVCHLTGKYPKWWKGRRFLRPVNCWIAGEDAKTVRDTVQLALLGKPNEPGTGLIPGDDIIGKPTARPGVPEAVDTISVQHITGGTSRVVLKAFDQGREAFQGAAIDVMWFDEEPPLDVYIEGLTRTMATVPGQSNGTCMCTFTPMKGLSGVVLLYMPGGKVSEIRSHDERRFVIMLSWEDAPHLSAEAKKELLEAIPPHQRSARTKGIPQLGAGAIYPVPEEDILCDAFEFPVWYKRVYALDVGWNRTAALWGAIDPETDVCYLYSEYYRGEAEPAVHAQAIHSRGRWIPGVIDPAARGRSQHDGEQLLSQYTQLGLRLTLADNAVESGIYKVWSRMSSGRIKVFPHLQNFLAEFRIYRRDEKGKIVKEKDHLLDACRYMCSSGISIAQQQPSENWGNISRKPKHQIDYDPYSAGWAATKSPNQGGQYSNFNDRYDNQRYRH